MASSDFADHVSDTDSTPSTDTSEHDFEDRIEKAVSTVIVGGCLPRLGFKFFT